MHDIEPHYRWRDHYIASEDERSPFYGRTYNEFAFTQKVYNYFIHPQWDNFGSSTLYMKILFVDYDRGTAVFEMIGEWNDCLSNDIMFLKRDVVDELVAVGIHKYILICENVLNFHGSDDCYYEEWYEDVSEWGGWVCFLNPLDHVKIEMQDTQLHHYISVETHYSWRAQAPKVMVQSVEQMMTGGVKELP